MQLSIFLVEFFSLLSQCFYTNDTLLGSEKHLDSVASLTNGDDTTSPEILQVLFATNTDGNVSTAP